MDSLIQCPVCTLYLHNGMSLESHLDTHPKDQVIKALCSITNKSSNCGSRTSTPSHSERSFRSRSRTPATEDIGRWNGSHRITDHDRFWHRTPSRTSSRTPKTSSATNVSRITTPDLRLGDLNFDSAITNSEASSCNPYVMKADKLQPSYLPGSVFPEFDPQYVYYHDHQEDKEIKYSRSAEYSAVENTNNLLPYSMANVPPSVKMQQTLFPPAPRRANDYIKIAPKQNNILVKTNMGGVQYIPPGVKSMHVVVPTTPTFLQQKNLQGNMILTGNIPPTQLHIEKPHSPSKTHNSLNQINTPAFTPGTTVVTQNSQIIYREMVHNLDGKPFISNIPTVLAASDNISNVSQTNSMYQNVMVVDQFGNTSCMYTTPQPILPKPCNASIYCNNDSVAPGLNVEKPLPNVDANKTLIIEVGPMESTVHPETSNYDTTLANNSQANNNSSASRPEKQRKQQTQMEKQEVKTEMPGQSKGLKILSNIKVEVPVQHNKNMINTVMDLTGPEYLECSTPEKILPDLDNNHVLSDDTQPSLSGSESTQSFSVIKNVGNPPSYNSSTKLSSVDSKLESDFADSCPVPDLICNEKPSISPCSELSESGDNLNGSISISPKLEISPSSQKTADSYNENTTPITHKTYRPNTLRLNNIYVKKHKKVLQIKNAKSFPVNNLNKTNTSSLPSSSTFKAPEDFSMNKMSHPEKEECKDSCESSLQTISIEMVKDNDDHNDFDADTEELSMDLEPVPPSSTNHSNEYESKTDMVQVKEEINTSNEGVFSNETIMSDRVLTPLEALRPINVITYGNMPTAEYDEESNHRELLDLEAASKNKHFVSMMNENYFGDNIYADYFTPDRVESFDNVTEREQSFREPPKDGLYNLWGEPSHRENEFVLPNFIHESYKIADSTGIDYEMRDQEGQVGEGDGCERDSKADVLSESRSERETPLNICADEKMPPRGELSGQESNGDMESWSGMYTEVTTPTEPYDLIARESWVSDSSEMDSTEKRENLDDDLQFNKGRQYTCMQCSSKFGSLKELRAHKAAVHDPPSCSAVKTTYSRMITARTIKKEEKAESELRNMLTIDSKESITSTILQVYETMQETKPKINALSKRRRRDYVCTTCKVDQLTEVGFNEHLKIHPLECLTCGKCFMRRANLALHIKNHLGIKKFKCGVCEKRFVTRQKLAEHENVHSGRAPVKCTHCDDTFRRYSNMVQHRDRHHLHKRAKVRDFVCQCGAVFHSAARLRWHRETHADRPRACPHCADKFVHAASLTRHVRRSHNQHFLPDARAHSLNVPCPVCKQVYLRANLRAHLMTHSGKRPHLCVICNKAFTTKWNLKLHRWTHMSRSAKPYKCTLCKGAFIRHSEFVSHMNAHKSLKPYTCNYCGCQFIRKSNCQRHVREHEADKKYACTVPQCGKTFHRSYYLAEHMRVHSGARPFACTVCGKTSSNKSNHNKHVKIHHAREPVATEA